MPGTLVSNDTVALTEKAIKSEEVDSSSFVISDETGSDNPESQKKTQVDSSSSVISDETGSNNTESPKTTQVDYILSKFRLQRVLNNNTRNKTIAVLGKFPDLSDTNMAIVILEKQAFQENDVAIPNEETNGSKEHLEEESLGTISYFCDELKVQTEFINNIYGSFLCTPPTKLSGVKATVVYPATEKHVEKYSISQKFVIIETPQLYKEITLPYITSSQFSLEWVYNILEHKHETERIIFEDPDPENGFILLPDLKWDGHNVENLYALAITHKRDIKSLRDLNRSHLPVLRNIRTRAAEAIESRYGILPTQLRMYLHYQPSFYHLHIHVNPLRNEAPGIWCEKSHMIDTVINNLELLPDYYEKATLPFVLYDGNKLLEMYEDKLTIRKSSKRLADTDGENNIKTTKKAKIGDETTEEATDKAVDVTN